MSNKKIAGIIVGCIIVVVVAVIVIFEVMDRAPTQPPAPAISLDYDLDTLEDLTQSVIDAYDMIYTGNEDTLSLVHSFYWVFSRPMGDIADAGGDEVVDIYNQTLEWAPQWKPVVMDALSETQNAESEISRIRDALVGIQTAEETGNQQEVSEAHQHFNSLDPTQRTDNDNVDTNGELGHTLHNLENAIEQYSEGPESGLTQLLAWCDEYSGVIKRLESLDRWSGLTLEWVGDDLNLGLEYKAVMYDPNWGSSFHPGGFRLRAITHTDLDKLENEYPDFRSVTQEEQNTFGKETSNPTQCLLDPKVRDFYDEVLGLVDPGHRQKVEQAFEMALASAYDLSYLSKTLREYKSHNAAPILATVANNWAKTHPNLDAYAYDDLMEIISLRSAIPNWSDPNDKFNPQILEWSETLTGSREQKMYQAWKIVHDWYENATYGGAESLRWALENKQADCGVCSGLTISILHAHGLGHFYPFTFQSGVGGHAIVGGDIDGVLYVCDAMTSLSPMQLAKEGDQFVLTDQIKPIIQPGEPGLTYECYCRSFESYVGATVFHIGTGEIERRNLPHILSS